MRRHTGLQLGDIEILSECRNLGLTVLLTLYHWPLLLWIHDSIACRDDISHSNRRGWLDQRTIIDFAKYSAFITKTFVDLVDIYATMNEPMVVSGAGYFSEKRGASRNKRSESIRRDY